ncbi:MAG: hypothetical protein U9Q66_03845, partial [Patescibacteria group bacterium]|nr:hypothetical protein [Patescibacteria group bacterium]
VSQKVNINTLSLLEFQVEFQVGVHIDSDIEKFASVIVESKILSLIVTCKASICPLASISIVSTQVIVGTVESIENVSLS